MANTPTEALYGLHQLVDIFTDRVNAENIPLINTAVQLAVQEHNRQFDSLSSLFVRKTTKRTERYKQVTSVRSQPLDQNGRAQPIKVRGSYEVAFPIQASGNAWGENYITRKMQTVGDVNDTLTAIFDGDVAWMVDHILAAIFAGTTWTFPDDEGDLTIQPLANNDGVTYNIKRGQWKPQADNHLLAQADAIDDAHNPFPLIYSDLTEHSENGKTVIVFIASNLKDDVENLDGFKDKSDPNIRMGVGNDELVGTLSVEVPGTLIGYVNQCWIVEWPMMPDDYMMAITDGDAKPVAQREYDLEDLKGFRLVGTRDDHPFYEEQFARWAGFGAWNRVGALVMRVGNASYAVPAGFASPMP